MGNLNTKAQLLGFIWCVPNVLWWAAAHRQCIGLCVQKVWGSFPAYCTIICGAALVYSQETPEQKDFRSTAGPGLRRPLPFSFFLQQQAYWKYNFSLTMKASAHQLLLHNYENCSRNKDGWASNDVTTFKNNKNIQARSHIQWIPLFVEKNPKTEM